jgi:hypothetical protein
MIQFNRIFSVCVIFILILSGCRQPSPAPTATSEPLPTSGAASSDIPYNLISVERMLSHLEVLTTIQAYSGFRTAATTGEVEAFSYIEDELARMSSLQTMGMEIERQSFDVFLSTEIHSTQLFLTAADGKEVEVPASGLRGSRYVTERALYFDTDGDLGDLESDPVTASGEVIINHVLMDLWGLYTQDVTGKILVVDTHLFDGVTTAGYDVSRQKLIDAIDHGAAGVILMSDYSNEYEKSHASFVNEGYFLQNMLPDLKVPILAVRLEDLAPAGITRWKDLNGLTSARMILDSDVISPAHSGNLIARIPGKDSSTAIILTAHIDSPNTPGGFDDGSGTVILLEMAEVLNQSGLQPDVDLYLVWNGSHENGIYGSAWFAATHADLLDRALGELTIDCLGMPLDGKISDIILDFNSYDRYGNGAAKWQDYLADKVAGMGIPVIPYDEFGLIADNSNFDTYNVPEADLIYYNPADDEEYGGTYIHYANHWHDAYETVDVVKQVSPILKQMAKVALTAAIQTGRDRPKLRTKTSSGERALFVSSHTQPASMITSLRELGMALAWQGFDVDPLPYGQLVTPADLEGAGIVVLLPTFDFPGVTNNSWSRSELDSLQAYVDAGGLLVVINSEYAHIMTIPISDPNEDKLDLNGFLEPLGITFGEALFSADTAEAAVSNKLTDKARTLLTYGDAGVGFTLENGEVLYTSDGQPIVALVDVGTNDGQVLVIGDLGLLIDANSGEGNLQFLQNIARYAFERQ